MAPTLGFTALLLIIALNLFLPIFIFRDKIYEKKNEIIASLTITNFALCIFAQLCLIYSYVVSDYSVANVYQNSHHLKPLIFKIAGSWGNHEGSMLLLLSVISFYSFIFLWLDKSLYKNKTLAVQALVILGFAMFTTFVSNPFARIFPAPAEGLGLNPILQDIGLALHPPMLYVGYLGFSIIFSLTIAALLQENVSKELARILSAWLLAAFAFLTAGVALGSWWAYRELGWGGYWFWDPVENISLMPWLAAIALMHILKLLKNNESCKNWTCLLAIITFTLCLIGIFLTRSGLLTSVHSFAIDARRGFFIILLIALISGLALTVFAIKFPKINSSKLPAISPFSKIGLIFLNNYILIIAIFAVFLGTIFPVFLNNLFNISINIGAKYYNQIFAILLIFFLAILIIYFLKSRAKNDENKSRIIIKNSLIFLFSAAFSIFIWTQIKIPDFITKILLFLTIFSTILAAFSKKKPANFAHLGFTLLVLGIIMSALGTSKEVNIKERQSIEFLADENYQIYFNGTQYKVGKNFVAREGVFTLLVGDKKIRQFNPQLRFYPISNQTTNEADIWHSFFGDLYFVMGSKDENQFYALRIYYKPFIYLIWMGCLLMIIAAFLKSAKIFLGKK